MRSRHCVTYRQLENLLQRLGFVETGRDDKAKAFRHAAADSLILLPVNGDDHEARGADLMSVERHLVGWGYLAESDFETFLNQGALPAATR